MARRFVMVKWLVLLSLLSIPVFIDAAGPPGTSQIYSLSGKKGQVVMLSNWPKGNVFSEYEDYQNSTPHFFKAGQEVWIQCGNTVVTAKIESIHASKGGMQITTVALERDPGCKATPWLMSNYEFPEQRWRAVDASQKEIEAIRVKLGTTQKLQVTKILSDQKGVLFLVFDPSIPSIYDPGGYRLMDERLNQVSVVDQAPLVPLIDLDGDGVPEVFVPSSDGMDAWLYKVFPKVEREMSYYYRGDK